MIITKLSLNRPITVLMLVTALMIFGFVSYQNLRVDLLPDLQYPVVTITTDYPGIAAKEINEQITLPIVKNVQGIPGTKRVHSVSHEGRSVITVEFHWGTDVDLSALYVREQVDKAKTVFPVEVENPVILPQNPVSKPILTVGVSGADELYSVLNFAEFIVKPRLEQIEGIANASVLGGGKKEIEINLVPAMMRLYGINLTDIDLLLKSYSSGTSTGTIKKGDYRYSIRIENKLDTVEDISQLSFKNADGVIIPLSTIAEIKEVIIESDYATFFQGEEIVSLNIYKEYGKNTVEVTGLLEEALEKLRKSYDNINITVLNAQSEFIEQAISTILQSLLIGAILAFFVLYLFISEFRSSVIIGLSIPVSIIGTFTALYLAGVNINLMTLGGLALGIGMLVDNSIITLENIYRKRGEKLKTYDLVYNGTKEVGLAITASTLTTIAVFLPIVYVKGIAAALFRDQALAVVFSLLLSLFTALTILPLLTYLFFKREENNVEAEEFTFRRHLVNFTSHIKLHRKAEWKALLTPGAGGKAQRAFFYILLPLRLILFIAAEIIKTVFLITVFVLELLVDFLLQVFLHPARYIFRKIGAGFHAVSSSFNRQFEKLTKLYHDTELYVLENKSRFVWLFLLIVFLTVVLASQMEKKLIPETETGKISIIAQFPEGMLHENLVAEIKKIEDRLLTRDEVSSIYTVTGFAGANEDSANIRKNQVNFSITLSDGYESGEFIRTLNTLNLFGNMQYIAQREFSILEQLILTLKREFNVRILAWETEEAYPWAVKTLERMQKDDVFVLPEITNYRLTPDLRTKLNHEFILENGLNEQRIIEYIEGLLSGKVPLTIKREGTEIPVRSKIGLERDILVEKFKQSVYTSPDGKKFPLYAFINIEEGLSIAEYYNDGTKPYVEISSELDGSLEDAVRAINRIKSEINFPETVQVKVGGEYEEMGNSYRSLYLALLLSAFLVYMIMGAQFESVKMPLIIISTLPLGMAGTLIILFIFGLSINIITIIGYIVLMGIIVNDAIVKVDRINQLRDEGKPLRKAVLTAGTQRLRPILMTTVTTVAGLLPTAIIPGKGSELYRPLAMVIIGGEAIGTVLTLIFVPLFYEILAGRAKAARKVKR